MHFHPFRTILSFALLVCLILLSRATCVWAAPHSTLQGNGFQPSGYGVAIAQKVSTSTTPQVRDTGHVTVSSDPLTPNNVPALPDNAPALQNVSRIAPPTSTDPSAIGGMADDGATKPDANGAGGTDNYLETVNSQLAIYDRSGNLQYTSTLQQWFGKPSTAPIVDPVVVWDDTGSRFIFSVDLGYELLLSVAQQTNATGNFCNYAFPTPINKGLGADFDKLGVNGTGVYLSANVLDPRSGNQVSNELFFASRTQLETCVQNVSYTTWTGLTNPNGSIASSIVPIVQETGTGTIEYLVNSYPGGACQLTLWTLKTANAQLSNTTISTQCYSPPPSAKQEGSTHLLGTGDCSLTQASYRDGLLTVALPGSYNWGNGGGNVSIVEWFVLAPSMASVAKQGAFGIPGYWLFYPAAVRTSLGHMLFVFNASGPTIYPSIWFMNPTTGTVALAPGNSYYAPPGGSPWGDYNSAWLDMGGSNPDAVWITGEYAQATNSWGTEFGLVTP